METIIIHFGEMCPRYTCYSATVPAPIPNPNCSSVVCNALLSFPDFG